MFLGQPDKFHIIAERGPGKEVKSPGRACHPEPRFCQVMIEEVPLFLIGADIHRASLEFGNQSLHERRCVDKAEGPVAENSPLYEKFSMSHPRVRRQIADSFPWKGKVLAM